jgi:hypothetical protein
MPEVREAVGAQFGILSAVQWLEKTGSWVLWTNRKGAVWVPTDGHDLRMGCERTCPGTAQRLGSAHAPENQQ